MNKLDHQMKQDVEIDLRNVNLRWAILNNLDYQK